MTSFVLLLLGVGCATGVLTVLFGFGGGFVIVPAVYAAQGLAAAASSGAEAMHTAVATSAAVMIVNASAATVASAELGRLRSQHLWPTMACIAVGATVGAIAANWAPETLLQSVFVAFIAFTIIDGIVRKGFVGSSGVPVPEEPLSRIASALGGLGIGAIASFLGVGGSVMTVPLLRRRGLAMAEATAAANPLSVPVAIAGTLVYALASSAAPHLGQVGHVSLAAAAVLLGGSLPTIALTKRVLVGRIPDRVHAIAYLVLLGVVLIAMIATMLG